MTDAILDSSAILAVINNEPGAARVATILENSAVSAVNYAEVVTKLVERGASIQDVRKVLGAIDLTIVDFDSLLAERTGLMREATKRYGLSLGDRACLALAEREGLPAITTDKRWAETGLKIKVQLVR